MRLKALDQQHARGSPSTKKPYDPKLLTTKPQLHNMTSEVFYLNLISWNKNDPMLCLLEFEVCIVLTSTPRINSFWLGFPETKNQCLSKCIFTVRAEPYLIQEEVPESFFGGNRRRLSFLLQCFWLFSISTPDKSSQQKFQQKQVC